MLPRQTMRTRVWAAEEEGEEVGPLSLGVALVTVDDDRGGRIWPNTLGVFAETFEAN